MRTHSGAEPLVGLEINLMFCVIQQDGAIPWRKHRKITLRNSSITKHAFLQLDLEYPNSASHSQTLVNIWTIGRKQALRYSYTIFHAKTIGMRI